MFSDSDRCNLAPSSYRDHFLRVPATRKQVMQRNTLLRYMKMASQYEEELTETEMHLNELELKLQDYIGSPKPAKRVCRKHVCSKRRV